MLFQLRFFWHFYWQWQGAEAPCSRLESIPYVNVTLNLTLMGTTPFSSDFVSLMYPDAGILLT
jgi:hypothetical protein